MPIALALLMVVPITVRVDAGLPAKMVDRAMKEAAAIWRDAGVVLEWDADDFCFEPLSVQFGDAAGRRDSPELPIAWIGVVNGAPDDHIYVSRANAIALLTETLPRNDLPAAAIYEYAGRALGRALAHEIGHYLFRSVEHDPKGVMATRRATPELFGTERQPFLLTALERGRLALRLDRDRVAKGPAPPLD